MLANENCHTSLDSITSYSRKIKDIMFSNIEQGILTEGYLPGVIKVKRRAAALYKKLSSKKNAQKIHFVNSFAIAVSEQNADSRRVVTAPTNGACGVIPAVLKYYELEYQNLDNDKVLEFFMTLTAIANLYAKNASLSGAEVGCQGEIGVASSMAAAGLTAILGGSVAQIEHAAEIAMEHHLGMTCDPIAGLVQVPCIERNAMGAIKAINAAQLSLLESGEHIVSLDSVIKTMWKTGLDMQDKYKETSQGGLALHVPHC